MSQIYPIANDYCASFYGTIHYLSHVLVTLMKLQSIVEKILHKNKSKKEYLSLNTELVYSFNLYLMTHDAQYII